MFLVSAAGSKCAFAHGEPELRFDLQRSPYYKTEMCRFWPQSCKNGDRCRWAHGEEELQEHLRMYEDFLKSDQKELPEERVPSAQSAPRIAPGPSVPMPQLPVAASAGGRLPAAAEMARPEGSAGRKAQETAPKAGPAVSAAASAPVSPALPATAAVAPESVEVNAPALATPGMTSFPKGQSSATGLVDGLNDVRRHSAANFDAVFAMNAAAAHDRRAPSSAVSGHYPDGSSYTSATLVQRTADGSSLSNLLMAQSSSFQTKPNTQPPGYGYDSFSGLPPLHLSQEFPAYKNGSNQHPAGDGQRRSVPEFWPPGGAPGAQQGSFEGTLGSLLTHQQPLNGAGAPRQTVVSSWATQGESTHAGGILAQHPPAGASLPQSRSGSHLPSFDFARWEHFQRPKGGPEGHGTHHNPPSEWDAQSTDRQRHLLGNLEDDLEG